MTCKRKRFFWNKSASGRSHLVGKYDDCTRWRLKPINADDTQLAVLLFEDIAGTKKKAEGVTVTRKYEAPMRDEPAAVMDDEFVIKAGTDYEVKRWGARVMEIKDPGVSWVKTYNIATITKRESVPVSASDSSDSSDSDSED